MRVEVWDSKGLVKFYDCDRVEAEMGEDLFCRNNVQCKSEEFTRKDRGPQVLYDCRNLRGSLGKVKK